MQNYGKLIKHTAEGNLVTLSYEGGSAFVEVITDRIINVCAQEEGQPRLSKAIEGDKKQSVDVQVAQQGDSVIIKTPALTAIVREGLAVDFLDADGNVISQELSSSGERRTVSEEEARMLEMEGHAVNKKDAESKIRMTRALSPDECIYGLGDKTGYLNKRGYEYVMWNTDDPAPQVDCFKSLYKSVPILLSLRDSGAYGIFCDNTWRAHYDLGKENDTQWTYSADGGLLDYYFIAGDSLREVISGYTYLTGRTPLPQLWTLGYHQSRWSYMDESEVRYIADGMRNNDIPCDAVHMDIDYMDGYRVFTWDKNRHPNPKKELEGLAKDGFKIVTIIDPGVKLDKGYKVYDEGVENDCFAKDAETGEIYVNEVWPGESVYPDFGEKRVRDWWGGLHSALTDMGVRGVWNDMNEPASFRGELPLDVVFREEGRISSHAEQHNVYGHNMSKATYEGLRKLDSRRPFIITRACYAGTQKYSTVWTGDNHSMWGHLAMAIPQLCNLGMSGFAFAGTDVGGFGSDITPELLVRWVQVGCFSPLFRNHSACGTKRQEPWLFGDRVLNIYRDFVKLRYSLLPYMYDLFRESEKNGLPLMRPLVLNYSDDIRTRNMNDQFMLGDDILVSPVVEQGALKKLVYLPRGVWYDYFTNEKYDGGDYVIMDAPWEKCPVLAREGAVIPNFAPQSYVGQIDNDKTLYLRVFPGSGSLLHYQDNGEDYAYLDGEYNEYSIKNTAQADGTQTLTVSLAHKGYDKVYGEVCVSFCGKEYRAPFCDGMSMTLGK